MSSLWVTIAAALGQYFLFLYIHVTVYYGNNSVTCKSTDLTECFAIPTDTQKRDVHSCPTLKASFACPFSALIQADAVCRGFVGTRNVRNF